MSLHNLPRQPLLSLPGHTLSARHKGLNLILLYIFKADCFNFGLTGRSPVSIITHFYPRI
jgi:hypothetical protein